MANINVLIPGKMQRLKKKVRSFEVTLDIYTNGKEVLLGKLNSLAPPLFSCPHLILAWGRHIQVSSVQELCLISLDFDDRSDSFFTCPFSHPFIQ